MPALAERLNVAEKSVHLILGSPIEKQPQGILEFPEHILDLMPAIVTRKRLEAQAAEIGLINYDADRIEAIYREKHLPLPKAYSILTVGFNPPKDAIELGALGEGIFDGFLPPEAVGHPGKVYAAGETLLISGRAHPTERIGDKWHNMLLAHELRVVKELVRRQRADSGIDPLIILTYVTGAAENTMEAGKIGMVIDDSEFTNIAHPGHGPIGLIEEWTGAHFRPKMGKSGRKDLMKAFIEFTQSTGIQIQPVITNGTPGAPEYQSAMEFALLSGAFDKVKENKALMQYLTEIYGPDVDKILALIFNMGVGFDLATVRQRFKKEKDFAMLALNLTTDLVGGNQSFEIDHDAVVEEALSHGDENGQLLMDFINQAIKRQEFTRFDDRTDYSIRKKLEIERENKVKETEAKMDEIYTNIFPPPETIPTNIDELRYRYHLIIQYNREVARMYEESAIPEYAPGYRKEEQKNEVILANLNGDGLLAYGYFIQLRDANLRAAKGRDASKERLVELDASGRLDEIPPDFRAARTPKFYEDRKSWHLEEARRFEQYGRIIAKHFGGIDHQDLEI